MQTDSPKPECYACDLSAGRIPLLGGQIYESEYWMVEHCMDPLGLGTLIVKPKRHVLHVWDLTDEELEEMGPLIGRASQVIRQITACEQVYVCLWSHGGFQPVHIHYVIQPILPEHRKTYEKAGPALQMQMFQEATIPETDLIEDFCEQARSVFNEGT